MGKQTVADFDERMIDVAQKAILATKLPNGSTPIGWGLSWSGRAAELLVFGLKRLGEPGDAVAMRELADAAFNGVFASDREGPVDWPAGFTLDATRNAVDAIAAARTRPAEEDNVTEVLLAVERHLAEMGAFMRVETPTAVGTIEYNRVLLGRVRRAVGATPASDASCAGERSVVVSAPPAILAI